jgi:hypothetical protein
LEFNKSDIWQKRREKRMALDILWLLRDPFSFESLNPPEFEVESLVSLRIAHLSCGGGGVGGVDSVRSKVSLIFLHYLFGCNSITTNMLRESRRSHFRPPEITEDIAKIKQMPAP